jgi:hypothetical protein
MLETILFQSPKTKLPNRKIRTRVVFNFKIVLKLMKKRIRKIKGFYVNTVMQVRLFLQKGMVRKC